MHAPSAFPAADRALLDLLGLLDARGYGHVTPTPATHARVVARPGRARARDVNDVFGWSLPFDRELLDPELLHAADRAGAIRGGRSTVRVSRLHGRLFLHSAYPTTDEHSVFLGPDSYRFADLVLHELRGFCPARVADIGAGAGVGGLVAAEACPDARITLTDINPDALRFARINAAHAGVDVETVECAGLAGVEGPIDAALANPPYIVDPAGREYRDGGDLFGGRLSLDMAKEALNRVEPGGRVILYTGSAVVRGRDVLRDALVDLTGRAGASLRYRELDPDVFGEELDSPAYAQVDRIAVVAAVIAKPE